MTKTKTIENAVDVTQEIESVSEKNELAHFDQPAPPAIGADNPNAQMMQMLIQGALNPDIDVEKMKALLDMSRTLAQDQAKIEFDQAFARIAYRMPVIEKDGTVSHNIDKNDPSKGQKEVFKFASYEAIMEAVQPLLGEEGFYLSFDSKQRVGDGGGYIVTGELHHKAGHSRKIEWSGALDTGPGRNNLQASKSTISYGKRNCVIMLLNIVEKGKDDDGVTGGTRLISESEIDLINKMIKESGTDEARFLEFMQASKVENMARDDFVKAVNALNVKLKKVAAAADTKP